MSITASRPVRIRRQARVAVRLRVRARVAHTRLDRDLAERPAQAGTAAHTARAAQLTTPRQRRLLAKALRRAVRDAGSPAYQLTAAIPVSRRNVGDAQQSLLGIAELLEGVQQVSATGIARIRLLLTNGASPLYNAAAGRSLVEYLWWVADGLREQDDLAVDVTGLELGERLPDV